MKSIIALAALLLTTSASAQETAEKFAITYQLDGQESTAQAAGTVVGSISGSTATLTVTPAEGNYITKDQITVIKTIPGDNAQTRTPSVSSPVEITASSTTADPSGVTTYTFDASDANYRYEVTANFLSRKDVADALIQLLENELKYNGGEAIEPKISVTFNSEALTADKDYTVAYSNNTNAGQGVVTITGIGMYKGEKSGNFVIKQASVAIWFEKADGSEAKELETTFGTTFTEPVLKLDPAGVIEVTYSVNDESVATINPSTGKLTILKPGTVVVTAAAKENYTNKEGSNYEADPTSTQASYSLTINKATPTLAFSKETATATMGQAFTAPTLNNPNSLALTYSSSKETVATISEEGVVTLVGEGETTIKATFAGNETYEAAEASYTLTVSKDKATLAYSTQTATATMGQAFTAPTLNNPNNLALTYSSSKETVATISEEGVVTIVGEGETTIKATFAGNDTYEAAEASYTLTVSKDKATLAFSTETATATMGQAFTAPTLNNPNSLAVTYSSSKETVATISEEGVVTIVGEGETVIKATFAGNDTYEAAEASYTLTVSKDKAALAYSVQTATATMGQAFTAPTLNNPNNLALTYSSSKETVATISEEGVVTIVGEGETVIKATFAGNDTYEAAEASYTLTVSKNKATLAYSAQTATATMGQAFTAPTLNNPNNLAVTYSSSKETVATISEEGVVTIVGEGETVIKATFAGNDTYEAAEASYTLTVSKDKATLAYSTQTATATMGQAFTAPTLNNPNSLAVTYSSSKETVATISEEGVVTIVGEGETVIKATFAGNDTYEAAEASYTLTVSKDKATLAYSAQTATATMGQAFTAPTLSNPNNLAVTYSSSKETVATISEEGVVTIVGEGETVIKATFAGNDTYEAAEASYTLTVSKDKATLAYSVQTATATMGQAFTAPTLSNPNNLAVTYSSSKETVATITAEGAITLVGEGETTIKATFAGNDTYEAAEASYTLTVSKDKATLAYSTQTATATMGQAFTAPTLNNPNNLALTYSSSKETVATISEEGVVTIVGEGETTIKATFTGNETYEAAEASYVLTVNNATMTVSATGFEGAYDKEAHSITVTVTSPEGAVVKYGTTEGTYDLTENPTYMEAGTYTVYYQVTKDGYETTTGSATVKINKAKPTVTAPTAKENLTYTGEAQELISAGSTTGGELQYSLDNATYSKNIPTGTEVNEYTVYYKVIGGTNYEDVAAASIKVTISRAAGEGYLLWVNDTQVTSDNAEDVLGHKTDSSKPYYIYNKDKKQLYMDNDQTRTTVIESRMPELTVYIKDANKIKRIFFNNTGDASNKGNLTFTTNGNFPGKLIIANPTKGQSAIKGFSNISYNWDLTAIEPDGSYYDTTTLEMKYKKETEAIVIADTITIGEAIVPITEKRAITFEESQLVEKDEDGKVKKDESGNPIKANLSNYSYAPSSTTGEPEKNVIHISLNSANISDDAGGFDIENGVGGIYIEDTMTDEKAGQVAQDVNDNKMVPGGTLYSESYDGFTFKLIAGSGTIEIDEIVENTHEFHLIIGTNKPITLNENNSIITGHDGNSVRVQAEIAFNVGAPTYCFLYMVKKTAGTRGTRLGKRDKAHGKLVSVQVRSTTVIPTEPPSEATGGVMDEKDDPEVETVPGPPTPPTGIKFVNSDKMAVKSGWYTIDGQKIAEPTQRGLYIKDGKKVVIK